MNRLRIAVLKRHLKRQQPFSDEWMETWRRIFRLRERETEHELAIIRAVWDQRQRDEAEFERRRVHDEEFRRLMDERRFRDDL